MVCQYPWVEVLVDSAYTQGLFTYSIPMGLGVNPGDIVLVPFGAQRLGAIAIRLMAELPPGLDPQRVKGVEEVVAKDFFSPDYWLLLLRVAAYYQTEVMGVIRAALPPGLLRRSQARVRLLRHEFMPEELATLSPVGKELLGLLRRGSTDGYSTKYLKQKIKSCHKAIAELHKRGWLERYLTTPHGTTIQRRRRVSYVGEVADLSKRQREILLVLRQNGGEMWLDELVGVAKTTAATIQKMAALMAVAIADQEQLRYHQLPHQVRDQPQALTETQRRAVDRILGIKGHGEVLLHGVTGSGKTEVYLQAIAPIIAQQKSVLVLVPEIGLTPQLLDRFQARFGDRVLTYHSALSDGERFDTWRQMLRSQSHIVIGTRSAIFAPLPNLGLIILDEEHDSSYKQDQKAPHYHARTVAQWRSQQEHIPLILGSATPALETWVRFQSAMHSPQGDRHYLPMPERIQARPLPPVQIVDMRQEIRAKNFSLFSPPLRQALHRIAETHEQGILFVARRGHSTFVSCRSCGYKMTCPYCDVTLSYHYLRQGSASTLRCHYCNHSQMQPKHCPECHSPYFKFFGNGTQKVWQLLKEEFPSLRCLRFDSDTTQRKGAHRDLLGQFARGEADILLGTQMLTKGLDVAQVTLVGILAADGLLYQSDYRAAERTFQTLTQVAGRAGRGDQPGQVILQTYVPDDPVLQAVKHHDYHGFAIATLEERRELNYPPYGRLVLLQFSGENPLLVESTATAIAHHCEDFLTIDDELLGPVPANILRIANRYRWQIVLKFAPHKTEIPDLTALRQFCHRQVSFSMNVDPLYID